LPEPKKEDQAARFGLSLFSLFGEALKYAVKILFKLFHLLAKRP
jgi:hypothetical protein